MQGTLSSKAWDALFRRNVDVIPGYLALRQDLFSRLPGLHYLSFKWKRKDCHQIVPIVPPICRARFSLYANPKPYVEVLF